MVYVKCKLLWESIQNQKDTLNPCVTASRRSSRILSPGPQATFSWPRAFCPRRDNQLIIKRETWYHEKISEEIRRLTMNREKRHTCDENFVGVETQIRICKRWTVVIWKWPRWKNSAKLDAVAILLRDYRKCVRVCEEGGGDALLATERKFFPIDPGKNPVTANIPGTGSGKRTHAPSSLVQDRRKPYSSPATCRGVASDSAYRLSFWPFCKSRCLQRS